MGAQPFGDLIHDALAAVGVTPESVSRWLGKPCDCAERQEKLNQLHFWAKQLLRKNSPISKMKTIILSIIE